MLVVSVTLQTVGCAVYQPVHQVLTFSRRAFFPVSYGIGWLSNEYVDSDVISSFLFMPAVLAAMM